MRSKQQANLTSPPKVANDVLAATATLIQKKREFQALLDQTPFPGEESFHEQLCEKKQAEIYHLEARLDSLAGALGRSIFANGVKHQM